MNRFLLLFFTYFFTAAYSFAAEGDSTWYYNTGVIKFNEKKFTDAEENFKKAVELSPASCLAHYGLGRVYILKKEKMGEAILHFKASVIMDPNFAKGFFYLGLAQLFKGKNIDSLHSFSSAFDKDKKYIEALYNIGAVYDMLGDSFKAFLYYKRYVTESKKRPDQIF